jgi:hypothetical protein
MQRTTRSCARGAFTALMVVALPATLAAQIVVPCDFDVDPNVGRLMSGGVLHLSGAPGSPSVGGQFLLINGNTAETDVRHDGFASPGTCNFQNIYLPVNLRTPLVNVDNSSLAIPPENVIVTNLPHTLASGTSAFVDVYVAIPPGTPAGRYLGQFQVRDSVILAQSAGNNNNNDLNAEVVSVEVTVSEVDAFTVVNADTAAVLDSLVIRGPAGGRVSGVIRVANVGNVPLSNAGVSVSDLRSESAVGIVIPSQDITINPASLAAVILNDSARATITVNIPRGILGGRYRGSILVQANGAPAVQVPLIVIVTSSRGIAFENNPVRNANGVARIAFNGDPGTDYQVGIFDMNGLLVYTTKGTVFAGLDSTGTPGTSQNPAPGADFAVSVTWPLQNGRGEGAASGTYLVVVESTVNGQRQLARDQLIVIR